MVTGGAVAAPPRAAQEGAHAEGMDQHLPLVVGGAPAEQQAVALGGLERRAVPFLKRLDRLDVVMAVDQDGGGGRVRGRPFGEDRGQPAGRCFPHLGDAEAGGAEMSCQPFGAAAHVAVPVRVGGDRGYRQPLLQVVDELARVRLDIATDIHA